MSDHDVAVDGDRQYGEEGDGQQGVPQQREEAAQYVAVRPGPVPEGARRQRQIEAAEQQIR